MNRPLWNPDLWRDNCIQPEAILTFFPVPAHKALTPPGNQEADLSARAEALTTDPLVDTADWMHEKSGYCSTWVGWRIAKDAG